MFFYLPYDLESSLKHHTKFSSSVLKPMNSSNTALWYMHLFPRDADTSQLLAMPSDVSEPQLSSRIEKTSPISTMIQKIEGKKKE